MKQLKRYSGTSFEIVVDGAVSVNDTWQKRDFTSAVAAISIITGRILHVEAMSR